MGTGGTEAQDEASKELFVSSSFLLLPRLWHGLNILATSTASFPTFHFGRGTAGNVLSKDIERSKNWSVCRHTLTHG